MLLIILSGLLDIHQQHTLSFDAIPPSALSQNKTYIPTQIIIPKIAVNLPITESMIVNNTWQINPRGASHLTNSAEPGSIGNDIIYGHNTDDLLGPIRWLSIGDMIKIKRKDNRLFTYTIVKTITVSPNDINILDTTPDETLTLYTCTGFADLQRFVIVAKRI